MKIAVLLVDGAKQIMLTPETDHERSALKMIAPGDKIEAKTQWGTFTDKEELIGLDVNTCRGGYYRGYEHSESLIFLITSKKEESNS